MKCKDYSIELVKMGEGGDGPKQKWAKMNLGLLLAES